MKRTDGPFLIYEILPGQLYQRGKLHKLSVEIKTVGLDYYGISLSVALAPPAPDPHLRDSPYYLHWPIVDNRIKDEAKLLELADSCAFEIENGGRVLTMCNAGRNRSGLLSALIVRQLGGIPGKAAMDIVRRERPNALANPYFEAWLESLD